MPSGAGGRGLGHPGRCCPGSQACRQPVTCGVRVCGEWGGCWAALLCFVTARLACAPPPPHLLPHPLCILDRLQRKRPVVLQHALLHLQHRGGGGGGMGVGARGGRCKAASVRTPPPPRHTHSTSTTLTHLDEQHLKRVEAQPIQVVLAIGVGPAHEQAGGAASGKQAGGERLGAVQRSPAPPPPNPLSSPLTACCSSSWPCRASPPPGTAS